jgi:hypothetical protein
MAIVSSPTLAGVWEPPFPPAALEASVELYWLPLGAGGWFIRLNGRIYEAIHALLERRRPLDLYHSALQVRYPRGALSSRTPGRSLMPNLQHAGWSSKAPLGAAGWHAGACSATRSVAGGTASLQTSTRRWQVRSP